MLKIKYLYITLSDYKSRIYIALRKIFIALSAGETPKKVNFVNKKTLKIQIMNHVALQYFVHHPFVHLHTYHNHHEDKNYVC